MAEQGKIESTYLDAKELRGLYEKQMKAVEMIARSIIGLHQSAKIPGPAQVHGYEALRRLEDVSFRLSEFFRILHAMQTEEGVQAMAQQAMNDGRVVTAPEAPQPKGA